MSAEDFANKHPEVADLIIDRGFRAQSLINVLIGSRLNIRFW
jgi:hypothetical protein